MKNRLFLAILSVLFCYSQSVNAQDDDIKKRLTAEYLEFIKDEGYSPTIDSDGDIKFKIEGRTHFVVVYNEESPQYVTFMTSGFQVGGEDGYDYESSIIAANEVNRLYKAVKISVTDSSVGVKIAAPYANIEMFKLVFYKLISYLETGRSKFIEEYKKVSEGGVTESVNNKVNSYTSSNQVITEKHLVASDNSCAIIMPSGYFSYTLNQQQILGCLKSESHPYVVILKESKTAFEQTVVTDLDSYVDLIMKISAANESISNYKSEPTTPYSTNGHKGVLFKYGGAVNDYNVKYYNYMFEINNSYYQVLIYYIGEQTESKLQIMQEIIDSFIIIK